MTRWPVPHTGWAKLGWKRWWGGAWGAHHVPCPALWSLQPPPHPPQRSNTQAPLLASKGRGEAVTAGCPLCAGPLAGLWRGERDKAGRGPLKHTHQKVPFMSMPNMTRNAHFITHRVQHTDPERQTWTCGRWVQKHLVQKLCNPP